MLRAVFGDAPARLPADLDQGRGRPLPRAPPARSRRWRRCSASCTARVHPTPGAGAVDPALGSTWSSARRARSPARATRSRPTSPSAAPTPRVVLGRRDERGMSAASSSPASASLGAFGAGRAALARRPAGRTTPRLRRGRPQRRLPPRRRRAHRRARRRLSISRALAAAGAGAADEPAGALAVAAAQLALADAGLGDRRLRPRTTAVVVGTAFGPPWVTEQLLRQILHAGRSRPRRRSSPSRWRAPRRRRWRSRCDARGPNLDVTQREASDLLALGEAARWIRAGRAERALVGVVDEMTSAPPRRARPLPRAGPRRPVAAPSARGRSTASASGVLAAEGAAVVRARERGGGGGARRAAALPPARRRRRLRPDRPGEDWGRGEDGLGQRAASAARARRRRPGGDRPDRLRRLGPRPATGSRR